MSNKSVMYSASLIALFALSNANAAVINATPSDYKGKINALKPGDTLNLAAGIYPLMGLSNLKGTQSAWITIKGPDTGSPAVVSVRPSSPFCCNLVQVDNASYLAIKNLKIDSANYPAINGLNARGTTHNIIIENCTFVGQGNGQDNVAISTKGTAWNWIIRKNKILGAGTGLYLGNSSGNYPFINGLIEQNLIEDTIGYNLQIKWQLPYDLPVGLSNAPHETIIRNNVLIKSKAISEFPASSLAAPRPNLLVGGFPASGPGANDYYQIYGNFFYENRDNEALFQGSGRVVFHDNLMVGGSYRAANFRNHDLPLKIAYAFNNTIYSRGTGIVVSGTPLASSVAGNLIFADSGVSAPVASENIFDALANAGAYVNNPTLTLGAMDFYPKIGSAALSVPFNLTVFSPHTAYNLDFNGQVKSNSTYRGAYFGEGINPGWIPSRAIKTVAVRAGIRQPKSR